MSPGEDNKNKTPSGVNDISEDSFSLSELLFPDTPEIKKIKSIYEKEYEYSDYLSEIEITIAAFYYEENRNLKDKDVIAALKNIKQNRDKPITFFKKDLEREIIGSLIEPLEEYPLTDHEFTLVIDYVLWVIDNRSWIPDKQAYVKWITYVMGLFSKTEEQKYEKEFNKFAQRMGVSSAQVDMLLMKRDAEDFFEKGDLVDNEDMAELLNKDRTAEDLETGFFLMNDDQKFDFLLDKGTDYVELVQDYILDLKHKGDFGRIQDFYEKFTKQHEEFFPLQFIMGLAYVDKDAALAKSYFEEVLRTVEKSEELPEELKKTLKTEIDLLTKLATGEPAEKPKEKTDEGKKGKGKSKTGKKK